MSKPKTAPATESPVQAGRKPAAKASTKAPAKTSTKAPAKAAPRVATKVPTKTPVKASAQASTTAERAVEPSAKPVKVKLVRDSFTLPEQDHALISQLKKRALAGAHAAKKSEVLRAALHLLASLSDDELLTQLRAVPALKTGRPRSRK